MHKNRWANFANFITILQNLGLCYEIWQLFGRRFSKVANIFTRLLSSYAAKKNATWHQ
jgi:hypothetical protein